MAKRNNTRRTAGVELTDRYIDTLSVPTISTVADRSRSPDGKVRRGLLLKASPTGSKSFLLRYDSPTGKTKLKLGTYPDLPLVNARALVDDIRASGMDPKVFVAANGPKYLKSYDPDKAPAPADTQSNRYWVQQYIDKDLGVNNKKWREQQRVLETGFLADFGQLTPYEITQEMLLGPVNKLSQQGKLRAAREVQKEVNTFYNWLMGRKRPKDKVARNAPATIGGSAPKLPNLSNPAAGIKFPKYKARSFTVEPDAMPAFLSTLHKSALRDDVKAVLATQLETFARVGEIASMPWSELDLSKKIWVLPASRSKNGEEHTVHLAQQTVKRLKAIKAAQKKAGYAGLYVFPKPRAKSDSPVLNTCISKDINKQRMWLLDDNGKQYRRTQLVNGKKTKVGTFDVHADLTPHSMRHSAVEWAKENDVPQEVRERLTNHAQDETDMAQRYGTGEFKRQCKTALQDFADWLEAQS